MHGRIQDEDGLLSRKKEQARYRVPAYRVGAKHQHRLVSVQTGRA
jgi:hypothetical protein